MASTTQMADKKLLEKQEARSDNTSSPKAVSIKVDVALAQASEDTIKKTVKEVLFGNDQNSDEEFLDLFLRIFETLDKNLNDLLDYSEYAAGLYVLLFRVTAYYKEYRGLPNVSAWKARDGYEEDLIKTIPPFKVDQLSFSPFCQALIRWIAELYRAQQLRKEDVGVEHDLVEYVKSVKKEIARNAEMGFGILAKDASFMSKPKVTARKFVDQSLNEVGRNCAFFWSILARIAFLPFVYATASFEYLYSDRGCILATLAFVGLSIFLMVVCYLPIFTLGLWLLHTGDDGFTSRFSFLEAVAPFIFYVAVSIISLVGQIQFLEVSKNKKNYANRCWMNAQLKVSEQYIKVHFFGEYRYKHKKDLQLLPDNEKKKDPKDAVFVWSDAGYQYSNYSPAFFFYARHILIASIFAFIHVVVPNVYRCIDFLDANEFGGQNWYENTIVVVAMTVGFFWCLVLLCFLQVAVDDMKVLQQSLSDLGALIDCKASKQRLNLFLDVRESQNLEYWLNLRATVYDNVRTSFTHGFAIPAGTAAVVLDFAFIAVLLWRIYISKVTLDVFNVLLIWDVVMVSLFILAFLFVVSRVNDAASGHVDMLNVIKFSLSQKVTQFLREQRVLEEKMMRDDVRRRQQQDVDFFEKEERIIGAQRVAEKEQKEKADLAAKGDEKERKPFGMHIQQDKADDDMSITSAMRHDVLSRRMSVQIDGVNRRGWMEYQTALASNLMLESAIFALNGQRHPLQVLGFVVNRALVTKVTSLVVAAAASGVLSLVSSWYSSHF